MDDLISRQAAIDFIDAGRLCNPNEPRWSDNEMVNFLKSRPSAQRWIPVSERLPGYGEDVLMSINGACTVGFCVQTNSNEAEWYYDGWYHLENDVNAWMPLPDPWEGEEDE